MLNTEKIINYIKKNQLNILLIIIWFVLVSISVFFHEMWRDEARVWSFVTSFSIPDLYNSIRWDGHTFLWYMILLPFAKLNMPVYIMQIMSFLFVLGGVCYLCLKSPFSIFNKILIIFSSAMMYFFPVVSRHYCLFPFFMFILADTYQNRDKKPLLYAFILVCISQTQSLMLGFSFICTILFVSEIITKYLKEKYINKNTIYAISLLFSNLLFLFFSFKDVLFNARWNDNFNSQTFLLFTKQEFLDFILFRNLYDYFFLNKIFFIFIAVFLLIILFKNKKLFIILLFTLYNLNYVFIKIWNIFIQQKICLIFLTIIFCAWVLKITYNNSKIVSISFSSLLILYFLNPFSGNIFIDEIKYSYSASKQTAKEIKQLINNNQKIAVFAPDYMYEPIKVYLGKTKIANVFNCDEEHTTSDKYIINNNTINNINDNIQYIFICKKCKNEIKPPYILTKELSINNEFKKELPSFVYDEIYLVYKREN